MVNIFKKWIPEQMTFALPASIRNMIENHLVGPTASTVLALNGQARFSPPVLPHTGRTLIPAVASAANCAQMRVRRRRTEWPTRAGCVRVGGVIGCEEQRVPTVEVCSRMYTGPRRSMPRCTPALYALHAACGTLWLCRAQWFLPVNEYNANNRNKGTG